MILHVNSPNVLKTVMKTIGPLSGLKPGEWSYKANAHQQKGGEAASLSPYALSGAQPYP